MFHPSTHAVVVTLAVLASATSTPAADIVVPDDQPTIQDAIDTAAAGDRVVVLPGLYVETIDFDGKAITVRSTDPDDPQVVASTVIDAQGAGPVVSFTSGEGRDSVLAGLTITGGSSAFGGGVFSFGAPTIVACVIDGNDGGSQGGGLYSDSGSPGPLVERCIFRSNDATEGGGAYVNRNAIFRGCLFAGNTASRGGGLYTINASVQVTNCTVVENQITNAANGAAVRAASGTTSITNSILWGNTDGAADDQVIGFKSFSFSNIENEMPAGTSISADPQFVNAASGDYRLSPGSPSIDTGSNGSASGLTVDLDGGARIQDGDCDATATVDMGAYEAAPAGVPPDAALAVEQLLGLGALGLARLDASQSAGQPGETLTYDWFVTGPVPMELLDAPAVIDLALDYGTWEVAVDVTGGCGTATATSTLVIDPDELAVFAEKKADVHLDDGKVKISGEIGLPFGVDYPEVVPSIASSLSLGGVLLIDETVALAVEGGQGDKWRYENDGASAGQITKLDVDWKGARYRLKDFGVELESVLISADETVLELKYKTDEIGGAFSIDFDGVIVDIDSAGTVSCPDCLALEIEKPGKEALLTIDVPLAESSVIIFRGAIGGVGGTTILVSDDLRPSLGRFKLEALVDPGLIGDPPAIDLAVMVGAVGGEGFPGSTSVPSADIEVKSDKWKVRR